MSIGLQRGTVALEPHRTEWETAAKQTIELLKELLYYGVSCISLSTTGSLQNGVRGCTSRMREELYPVMEERMKAFNLDH